MKVQLIFSPPNYHISEHAMAERLSPPMGILYLGSYLRSKMPDIILKVTDGCRIGYQNTMEEIRKFHPDILGISFLTTMAAGAVKLANQVKEFLPETTIVMGGPHATALPLETLEKSKADIVVVGEGEETFYQIVKTKKESNGNVIYKDIPGVWSVEKNGNNPIIHKNAPAKFIKEIDDIPFPAWDLINLDEYTGYFLSKQSPEAPMFFARGCPYHCTFCSNAVWKSSKPALRLRSPGNIVDEIEYLKQNFGVKEIFDQSDEFNNSLGHALAVCKEMKKRDLKITWKTMLRVSPFTEELAKEMADTGCWYVHLGIESANKETIKGIKKGINLEEVKRTCALLRKYNIKIMALFMIYNVWEENGRVMYENTRMSENTLRYAYKLFKEKYINCIGWSVTTPYPGSKLYNIAVRHSLLKPQLLEDLESWQRQDIFMMNLPCISRREQSITKLKGEILRGIIMLKNMDFKLKDLPYVMKRGIFNLSQLLRR